MKKLSLVLAASVVAAVISIVPVAHTQTLKASASGHQVTLTWAASADSTSSKPGTVSVYRANEACPATVSATSSGFTAITTAAAASGPYTDSTVTAGTWCYFVTATIGSATSPASNAVQAVLLPLAPSSLAIGSSN